MRFILPILGICTACLTSVAAAQDAQLINTPHGQGDFRVDLAAVHDVSRTYEGLLATTSYPTVRNPNTFVAVDVPPTWTKMDYSRTYVGISAVDAAGSGLAAYRAGSDIRAMGVGLSAGYYFDSHLCFITPAGATYLVGDTANSPVTDQGSQLEASRCPAGSEVRP